MTPIEPTDANLTLRGDGNTIGDLQAVRFVTDGTAMIATLWQPNADELIALAAGKPVMLITMGDKFPPVMLAVASQKDRVSE